MARVSNVASTTSPTIIGVLPDSTHNFYAGAWYTAARFAAGVVLFLLVTTSARGKAGLSTQQAAYERCFAGRLPAPDLSRAASQ